MTGDEGPSQNALAAQAQQIVLQVGERRFITTRETLEPESGFFISLLSGRWNNALPDGSYFIDADPALFEHILRYLRRRVLPIFYDGDKGHDHALYLALLEEARYFQIARLEEWLENKRYLSAVTVDYSVDEFEGTRFTTLSADKGVEHYATWGTKKVYVCPRGIEVHRGEPGACGRRCLNARDSGPEYEEEPVLRVLRVKKQTVFDMQACLSGRFETDNDV